MKRNSNSSRRGSAILEFALAVVTLTFLFTGTFQYGYSFYVYNNLQTSIRSAARFASMQPYPSATFINDTKSVAMYGKVTLDPGDEPVAPGLQASNVIVNVVIGANGAPAYVHVALSGYQLNSVFGTWTLQQKPASNFTYMGHYQP